MERNSEEEVSVMKTKKLLEKDGIIVNFDQAKAIMEFFRLLADLVVEDYLNTS